MPDFPVPLHPPPTSELDADDSSARISGEAKLSVWVLSLVEAIIEVRHDLVSVSPLRLLAGHVCADSTSP